MADTLGAIKDAVVLLADALNKGHDALDAGKHHDKEGPHKDAAVKFDALPEPIKVAASKVQYDGAKPEDLVAETDAAFEAQARADAKATEKANSAKAKGS